MGKRLQLPLDYTCNYSYILLACLSGFFFFSSYNSIFNFFLCVCVATTLEGFMCGSQSNGSALHLSFFSW